MEELKNELKAKIEEWKSLNIGDLWYKENKKTLGEEKAKERYNSLKKKLKETRDIIRKYEPFKNLETNISKPPWDKEYQFKNYEHDSLRFYFFKDPLNPESKAPTKSLQLNIEFWSSGNIYVFLYVKGFENENKNRLNDKNAFESILEAKGYFEKVKNYSDPDGKPADPHDWIGKAFKFPITENQLDEFVGTLYDLYNLFEIYYAGVEEYVKFHFVKIKNLLTHNPNLILYGPPGTGKTYTAKGFAYFVINSDSKDANKNWEDELEIYKLRERLHIFIVVDSNVVNKEITINKDDKDNFANDDFVLVYEGNGKAKIRKIKINGDKVKVEEIKKKNEPLTINNNDLKGKLENLKKENNLKNTLGIWLVIKPSGSVAYDLNYEPYEPNFYKLENPKEYDGLKPHDIFRWAIVQFHPAYNYDDFIYGIEPKTEEGQIQYNTVERVLVQMSKLAEENPDKEYVLIIDEINRANLPAVLGELIYALEYRGKEVNTLYGKTIRIPENLYIIGTMNTADRSAGRIDYAIRRRFTFYPMHADSEQAEPNYRKLLMEAVNEFIENHISPEYDPEDVKIGHTYFMGENEKDIAYKFIYQVVPLIYEYIQDGILNVNKDKENKGYKITLNLNLENGEKEQKDYILKGGQLYINNDKKLKKLGEEDLWFNNRQTQNKGSNDQQETS